ncbi:MAG: ATP-binding protein, partial [Actinomyces massiliensis]
MSAFQVDLRGMVDLLSRNLYSGPRVYVRELLQNAVDAIAARRAIEPDCPQRVTIELGRADGAATLTCTDTGVGLTAEEVDELLSTIGASSKRDELGLARGDYLGQFGIGLLSCFMVSPEIVVTSRSARGGGS